MPCHKLVRVLARIGTIHIQSTLHDDKCKMSRTRVTWHNDILEDVRAIQHKVKIFDHGCNQLVLLNARMNDTHVRFERACRNQNAIFQRFHAQHMVVLQGVRTAYYRSCDKLGKEIDKMITKFEADYHTKWSEWCLSFDSVSDEENSVSGSEESDDTDDSE